MMPRPVGSTERGKKITGRNPDMGALSHEEEIYGTLHAPQEDDFHVTRFIDPLPVPFNEIREFSRNAGNLDSN